MLALEKYVLLYSPLCTSQENEEMPSSEKALEKPPPDAWAQYLVADGKLMARPKGLDSKDQDHFNSY